MDNSLTSTAFQLAPERSADGTHLFDTVNLRPSAVIQAFGQGSEGDGYKVSRRWVFRRGDAVFTLYDWKSTNLYQGDLWRPDELWACNHLVELHVGSKAPTTSDDIETFLQFLQGATQT